MRHTDMVEPPSILSDEFEDAVARAGLRAREAALAEGHPVVYLDYSGRYIQEWPDGTKFQVHFRPGLPREAHLVVLGELAIPVC